MSNHESCQCKLGIFDINPEIFQYTTGFLFVKYKHCITNNVVNKKYDENDILNRITLHCSCTATNNIPIDFEVYYYDKITNEKIITHISEYNQSSNEWILRIPRPPVGRPHSIRNQRFIDEVCDYPCETCGNVSFSIKSRILNSATGNTGNILNNTLYWEYTNCNEDIITTTSIGGGLIGNCVCLKDGFISPEILFQGPPFEIYYYRNNIKVPVFASYANGSQIASTFWDNIFFDFNSENSSENIKFCQGDLGLGTPTLSPTPTSTPNLTPTPTPTTTGITVNDCDILLNYVGDRFGEDNYVGLYRYGSGQVINLNNLFTATNTNDERFLPNNLNFEFIPDIAFTDNKLWLPILNDPFNGDTRIIEYDITLSPFSATYNRNSILSGTLLGNGLTVGPNNTLLTSFKDSNTIVEINLNNFTINSLFEVADVVLGDIIYTPENRLIVSLIDNTIRTYDFTTGNEIISERISGLKTLSAAGLFMRGGVIHSVAGNQVWKYDPTQTDFDVISGNPIVLGSESLILCNSQPNLVTPTPTPSVTTTLGITPTSTVTPTPTPTSSCPVIERRDCQKYQIVICFNREITPEIEDGFEYRFKFPCTTYGENQTPYEIFDENINPWFFVNSIEDNNDAACPGPDFDRYAAFITQCYLSGITEGDLILRNLSGRELVRDQDYIIKRFNPQSTVCPPVLVVANCDPTPTPSLTPTPTPSDKCPNCYGMILTLDETSDSATFEYETCGNREKVTVNLNPENTSERICYSLDSYKLISGKVNEVYDDLGLCPQDECTTCCSQYTMTINDKRYFFPDNIWDDSTKQYILTGKTITIENKISAKCISSDCADVNCYFVLGWYFENETEPRFISGWHMSENRPISISEPNVEFNLDVFSGITEILPQDCNTGFTVNNIEAGNWNIRILSSSGSVIGGSCYSKDCYSGGTNVYTPYLCDCLSGLTISAITITPTPTVTPTVTTTPTGTPTVTPTVTPTATSTITPTPSITVTPGLSPTVTPTVTPTITPTPSNCPNCYVYEILSLSDVDVDYQYTDCVEFSTVNGVVTGGIGNSDIICAVEDSVTILSGPAKITKGTFCGCEGILL